MGKLTEDQTLSRSFGNYQTSGIQIDGPPFIPPHGKVSIEITVSYEYPNGFTTADKGDMTKVSLSVDRRLKEFAGVVLFDQNQRYRIDLPNDWKNWNEMK